MVRFQVSDKILNQYIAKYAFYKVLKFDTQYILRVMTS